jgi:hypothetical protein
MQLTQAQIDKVAHIPTAEVEDDIEATQKEIQQMQAELSILIQDRPTNKLDIMKREVGIRRRAEFVESLTCILNYRKGASHGENRKDLQAEEK